MTTANTRSVMMHAAQSVLSVPPEALVEVFEKHPPGPAFYSRDIDPIAQRHGVEAADLVKAASLVLNVLPDGERSVTAFMNLVDATELKDEQKKEVRARLGTLVGSAGENIKRFIHITRKAIDLASIHHVFQAIDIRQVTMNVDGDGEEIRAFKFEITTVDDDFDRHEYSFFVLEEQLSTLESALGALRRPREGGE